MLRVAICDDLPEAADAASKAVRTYFCQHDEYELELSIHYNPLLFLESLDKNGSIDVLILDVCMPGIDGTQVASEIRKRREKSEIIFVTTSDEFAVEAFALKAAHYLVKPFTTAQFAEAMDRALARFAAGQAKKVSLRLSGGSMRTFELDEILFVESYDHTQTVYLRDGSCETARESLSQLFSTLEDLSPGQFVSPYKGYLVNQKAVRTIEPKNIVMCCGKKVPLARGTYREFSKNYFAYQFSEGGQR